MKPFILLSVLIAFYYNFAYVQSLAVMSVDLGSEWMKIGIVSPGVPMEIALNKESKRKTPAILSIRDNVRLFGEDAQVVGVRFPKQAYSYLLDLLGKNISHPLVKLYRERFPYYDIVEDANRGTILFKHDKDTFYSPEELISQLLAKAKEFAENGAQQPIKECVLTVPGYFNQVERKALLQAAELANLKVLQLINDYTAVALNYGIFRSKTFNETANYVMFYDVGATSTTATLVSYQTVKTKEKGYVETHPQATVLGVGYDRTLGGLEIQVRLQRFLAEKFNDMKKTKNDVFKNDRSMAKLFKEAGRVKNVLSANAEHYAQIEGLLDEKDFRFLVKREDMEGLIQDLLKRVSKPVEQALKTAHLTLDVVNQVVLVGAGTRVPKIQEELKNYVKQDLAKNLNTDEAATMGAVYRAADLSTGFKVAKFIARDAVLFPIQVTFERETEDGGVKQVKRTLFGLMNPYPQKKIITFNKHTTDFSFNVNYADLDYLLESEVINVGSTNLSEFRLTGVAEAFKKHNVGEENVDVKGIKAHFGMDESGLLNLANVELVVEKTVVPTEEEGTLSKLGSTFSKLFGGEDEKPEKEKTDNENHDEEKLPTGQEEEDQANTKEETKKEPIDAKINPEKPSNAESEKKTNSSSKIDNSTNSETTQKEVKPKVVTIKEPITAAQETLTIHVLNENELKKSTEKIDKLDKIEREINRRATALNSLEGFVIDVQNKLYEDEFLEAATKEEIEKIKQSCSEISDWLYEDGSDADADTYEKKLDDLRSLTRDLFSRVWEHKERPEALKALHSMLNQSSHFATSAKNLTKTTNLEKDVFTDVEVQSLETLIKETADWRDKAVKEQNNLKKNDPVKLTVKMLSDKMAALDREVKYLVNKIKMWRPKKTAEKPVKEKDEEKNKDDQKINQKDDENSSGKETNESVLNEENVINVEENISQSVDEEKPEIEPSKAKKDEENHMEL